MNIRYPIYEGVYRILTEGQGSLLLFGVNNQRNTFFLLFTFQWTEMNGLIIWIGQCFIFLF